MQNAFFPQEARAMDGRLRQFLTRPIGHFLGLIFVASLFFFGQLHAPLLEPQEPRYAEIPRQMLAEGRFVLPVLHGQPYLDKPPLLYWLVMGSYQLFGVHDWSARLLPGLVGVLTVLTTWWWGRRTLGERAGFWGAMILCLSARFVYLERMLTMDGLLCLCVTAALATGHAACADPRHRRRLLVLSAIACGLGLLTKGPIALLLVAPPLLVYGWLDRRWRCFRWREVALYFGVMLAVAAPWYLALTVQQPQFAWSFFWTHNVVRFFAPFDHEEPFWFHLPGLLLGTLPWILLLPGLARYVARRWRRRPQRPPALGFCMLAFLWGVAFFSAAGCKRATYILPALPPFALALGAYFSVAMQRREALALPAALTVPVLGFGVVLAAAVTGLISPTVGVLLSSAALLTFVTVLVVGRGVSWSITAGATFACLFVGLHVLLPVYNQQFALRQELRQHADYAAADRLLVVCYPQRYDSVSYYLPRADVRVYTTDQKRQMLRDLQQRDGTLLVVKSGRPLQELLAELPAGVEFVSHGKQGAVTVGWVCTRVEPLPATYAQRE
jgi:4-amino-4-deoxy-L-arabinose transferase-like glycosyltransferase